MINGLDRINYDQLTGLVAVKATSIETDEISYDEIYTLDGITSNIQTQIDNLSQQLYTTAGGGFMNYYLKQHY
jgi:hypothetical protein